MLIVSPERAQTQDAHQDRQRNGHRDDDRAFPVAQKHQDHDRRQHAGDDRFANHALD